MRIRIDGKVTEFISKHEVEVLLKEACRFVREQVKETPFLPIENADKLFNEWMSRKL